MAGVGSSTGHCTHRLPGHLPGDVSYSMARRAMVQGEDLGAIVMMVVIMVVFYSRLSTGWLSMVL